MSTELEDEIRTALRASAESVTRDRLRYADAPRARSSRGGPLYAVLAAAAVVVAIALGTSLWTGVGRHNGPEPAAGNPLRLAGTGWRLTSVQGPKGTVAIPDRLASSVQFFADGTFLAEDSVNAVSGKYREVSTDIAISGPTITGIGYVGKDQARLAAVDGIDAVFASGPIGVIRHGDRLTLHVDSYTLQLTYLGTASDATASASATVPPASTRS